MQNKKGDELIHKNKRKQYTVATINNNSRSTRKVSTGLIHNGYTSVINFTMHTIF